MKKLICVFLLITVLLSAFSVCAFAQSGVVAEKLSEDVQAGDELSLCVIFTADNLSNAFQYDLIYDSEFLEFIDASNGMCNQYENGKIRYVNVGNSKSDTAVFVFVTKKEGNTYINIKDVLSADTEEHSFPDLSYGVTISAFTRGDANGDGKIDTADLAQLKLHLAGLNDDINDFADFDKNGEINTTDLASLKLYLAGC